MFMQAIDFQFWEIATQRGFGLPLVAMDFEFERPMWVGDGVIVELTQSLGTRSVRFEYVVRCGGDVMFSGYEQHVCVHRGGNGSRDLSDNLGSVMAEYAVD